MIENTFLHVKGIGRKSEEKFWYKGYLTWSDFINRGGTSQKNHLIKLELVKSKNALETEDYDYFLTRFSKVDRWRFFNYLKDSVAYIDIETTGFKGQNNYITTIALYDGKNIKYYVHGKNLNDFKQDIKDYKLIVTYNGDLFDLPFIKQYFNIDLPQFHIDLRWIFAELGYRGGLKGIEKSLGISRGDLDGVTGFFAVLLWREYKKKKNKKALDTLIAYNIEDVINLEYLMFTAYNVKIKELGLFKEEMLLTIPIPPIVDIKPDIKLVNRLKEYVSRFNS